MEKLPMEIIENILGRLQTEAALQAKRVCTTWRFLLRIKVRLLFAESYFMEVTNKLYYGDEYDLTGGKMNYNYSCYDKLDKLLKGTFVLGYGCTNYMVGSCNGLVCIQRLYMKKPFTICNPITGEVFYAPRPKKSIARGCDPSEISGFGYCHSKNEYKIVTMHCRSLKRSRVLVYTIGGVGGWRRKGSIHIHPSDIEGCIYRSDPAGGVYVNGALHWLYRISNNVNKQKKDCAIMYFDLEDEKFEFMDLSQFQNLRYDYGPKLLGGKDLYLVYSTVHSQPYCTDIWAYKKENTDTTNACDLKENYNDHDSWPWIKEYSIEWKEPFSKDLPFLEPLAVTRIGEFIFRCGYQTIYCYDLKTMKLHKLVDGYAVGCDMINVIPHVNTTVSILSLRKTRGSRSSVMHRKSWRAWKLQLRRPCTLVFYIKKKSCLSTKIVQK